MPADTVASSKSRPEVVISNINAALELLNDEVAAGNRLWIRLEGKQSNRSAICARVKIESGGSTQRRDVVGGGSFYSQSDLALHFGLGQADSATVEVRWPSGKV